MQAPEKTDTVLVRGEDNCVLAENLWDLYLTEDAQAAFLCLSAAAKVEMFLDSGVVDVESQAPPNTYVTELDLKLYVRCHDGQGAVIWTLDRETYDRPTRRKIIRRLRDFFPKTTGEDICTKIQISMMLGMHPFV